MQLNNQQTNYPLVLLISCMVIVSLACSRQLLAGTMYLDCYTIPGYPAPKLQVTKALYVLIDQTIKLTPAMKQSVIALVSDWGKNGESVKISRFSANIKGQYTELVFDEIGNIPPTQDFLFHLRRKDKRIFLDCIKGRENEFNKRMTSAITDVLKLTDDKLPQTDLIYSLNEFAKKLIGIDDIADQTVLIVSDGLEHSDLFSFHKKGVVKKVNGRKSLEKIRKSNLIPDWEKSKVYFFGIGYVADETFYLRPKIVTPLTNFWSSYFKKGNATLYRNSFGTPMLLTKSIL